MSDLWRFAIDVGGTFTDVVAVSPHGQIHTLKWLSSGARRGQVEAGSTTRCIRDLRRAGEPDGFWNSYTIHWLTNGSSIESNRTASSVAHFDHQNGRLTLDPALSNEPSVGVPYELRCHEEAPVTAIRFLMGLGLHDKVGPVEIRLGTTRATNALLERKGARVLFVTTQGFADVLKIGHQDRPRLFDLQVRKRHELAERVVEIEERLAADGTVLLPLNRTAVRARLEPFYSLGFRDMAVCLLHAHVNPSHEQVVAKIAREIGFDRVSVSTQSARLEGMVRRGDTTVLDAYLAPVIEDYVQSLRHSMPEARILLMTSNGGLIPAEHVQGKDTILSGPAGGVVGCGYVARSAKVEKAIGFDMGGTSTDVCRMDMGHAADGFEFEQEAVKAGICIVTPMLAVETVAAGGGSLCVFDGQKLTVGPHSAGADPGPACYGRGGPLTVTDVNFYLGRIVRDQFPFVLDSTAVESRLSEVRAQVQAATGRNWELAELAEGFLHIANAHMAQAIKEVSVAKGYDAREYVLVSFGGAGGQHACCVARLLGIRRVLISSFAGVLSALGIAATVIRRIAQRSVRIPLDAGAGPLIEPVFTGIIEELRTRFREEELDDCNWEPPVRSMELCYQDQGTTLALPADPLGQVRIEFENRHRQLYGYVHPGRPVEIRVVRIEFIARADGREACFGLSDASNVVNGTIGQADVAPSIGRRVLAGAHGTIVIEPGWEMHRNECGNLLLTDSESQVPSPSGVVPKEEYSRRLKTTGREPCGIAQGNLNPLPLNGNIAADPIQLELFNNRFASIAERMGAVLRRTALSVNVKERLDFSCAIFDAYGDLVVNAPHIPVHLGGMSDCVKALIEDVGTFADGDVYATNDPYRGGSHLNDVTIITPILSRSLQPPGSAGRTPSRGGTAPIESDSPLFFVASRAHHAEIGGTRPGSMPPDSTCLAEEGVLIRAFPLVKGGQSRFAEMRALLSSADHPSRAPDDNLADLAAQIAANQTGVLELHELVSQQGPQAVLAYMGHIQRAAEQKMRNALATLPAGVRRFEDCMDDGTTIRLTVTLRSTSLERLEALPATFDFTGTDARHPGNLNANRAIVKSALLYCLRCLIDEDIPLNAGVLAPVELILPECFLNPRGHRNPHSCPAIVGGNVETSQRIVDVVFGALGIVAASQGTMNNLLMGNERFGYYETICGGAGAGPDFHGADAVHTHMTNTRLTDPEILEARYPVRLLRFAIRRGSGGDGRFQGGCGVIRELEFLEPLQVSILSQRRTLAPYGLEGGSNGQPGRNRIWRVGATCEESLGPITHCFVRVGDRLILETPGGGGFGARNDSV